MDTITLREHSDMSRTTPYACFRFNGEVVNLNRQQFEQAVRDSRLCRCNSCLACRALAYHREVKEVA